MLVSALIILACAEALSLAWLSVVLIQDRRKLAAAREELARGSRRSPRSPAGMAMKAVAQTAARVRDQGVVGGLLTSSFEDLTRWITEQRSDIARVAAPDGTVAIFFSDIEDSTALNEQWGDERWVRMLSAHDSVLRRAVQRCGGHVVKSQGDGFMVVFVDAAHAARAAVNVQRAFASRLPRNLRLARIRIRIGLHVGETVAREGDYFGRNVAIAARVAATAAGGEILVTDELRAALRGDDDFRFEPCGDVELKGLAGRHTLWMLRWRSA